MSRTAKSSPGETPSDKQPVEWDVIVLNDDRNTYEGMIEVLMDVIPRMGEDLARDLVSDINYVGRGRVWTGSHKVAVFYRQQLIDAGLTVDRVRKHKVTEQDKERAALEEQLTATIIEGLELALSGLKRNLGVK